MTLAEFGSRLWGIGPDDAASRIKTITKAELDELHVTVEMAEEWRAWYLDAASHNEGLPTSPLRAALLQRSIDVLRGAH
jgi:hypothetical protein